MPHSVQSALVTLAQVVPLGQSLPVAHAFRHWKDSLLAPPQTSPALHSALEVHLARAQSAPALASSRSRRVADH